MKQSRQRLSVPPQQNRAFRRSRPRLLVFAVLALFCLGLPTIGAVAPKSADTESVAALRKRAEAAEDGERVKLYVELARLEVEEANAKFTAGDADRAQAEVRDATADAEQATQIALSSRKRLKQTQLALHELARRLDGIEHSLSFEDRPPIKNSVEKLQTMATNLLEAMFKKK